MAGFHAAQSFLFETTGNIFKTHRGVQGEFGRLAKDDFRFDPATRAFLGRNFERKTIPEARLVVACVGRALGDIAA